MLLHYIFKVFMKHPIILAPAGSNVGLTTITSGMIQALQNINIRVKNFALLDLGIEHIEKMISNNQMDDLLHDIYAKYENESQNADIIVIEGMSYVSDRPYVASLNRDVARALAAKIILVTTIDPEFWRDLETQIKLSAQFYPYKKILGCVINKFDLPACSGGCAGCEKMLDPMSMLRHYPLFRDNTIALLGCIPMLFGEVTTEHIAKCLNTEWANNLLTSKEERPLTPTMFRHELVKKAKSANKRIVLPEGTEPRTIKAANICAERGIAQCVLLGNPQEIEQVAIQQNIVINKSITIIDPASIAAKYVAPMIELRKNKGLTAQEATEQLKDNVVLGTMMIKLNEIDGLVSGAIHTTANTIRPALQLIKTKPGVKLVSSGYFLCLPEQVLIFADCAFNIKPSVEELADIAIQSAETAIRFNIPPRIAMISYSTGNSGHGEDVDKVIAATQLIKQKRPDLLVDGPLQYDAALIPEVAKTKLPSSLVAGKATVLIFPDLTTGNAVAKAVQRSANIVAVGPLAQGLDKPANDLSRSCSVEDIVYTIAMTAVQAGEN
jgi:phosphate acetyltransferase